MTIAKLPLAKDIDDFVFDDTPIDETLVGDLAGGDFLAHRAMPSSSVAPAPARPSRHRHRKSLYPRRCPRSLLQRVDEVERPRWSDGMGGRHAVAGPDLTIPDKPDGGMGALDYGHPGRCGVGGGRKSRRSLDREPLVPSRADFFLGAGDLIAMSEFKEIKRPKDQGVGLRGASKEAYLFSRPGGRSKVWSSSIAGPLGGETFLRADFGELFLHPGPLFPTARRIRDASLPQGARQAAHHRARHLQKNAAKFRTGGWVAVQMSADR
jgi:hypothetical protein